MAPGQAPAFTEEGGWCAYKVRLEAYFQAQEITDEAKQRALLVAVLSNGAVKVLQGRCHPKSVNDLTYSDVTKHLQSHYEPQVNETAASTAASCRFFTRTQAEGERVRDFVAALRRMAEDCNFGDMLHRMLRDRIVCGVRDDDVRRLLLTRGSLTLKEAEDFVMAAEAAAENAQHMQPLPSPVADTTNFVRPGLSRSKSKKARLGLLRGPPVHLTVKEGARPRFRKARTVPYALKQMLSAELDQLVNEEVLSPVTSAEWATPVVPVVKKDGYV
ncbi:uncharacterized protein LOC142765496 [Rhipicephalus microplus]|uniref:uncharacterized protein LOC142765496 n=1 Tax=Rhipicephalus microplus TaxID=6941 RepID=UPI003F6D0C9F